MTPPYSEPLSVASVGDEPGAPTEAGAIDNWRSTVLNRLAQYCLGAILFSGIVVGFQTRGEDSGILLVILVGVVGLGAAVALPRASLGLRAGVISLTLFVGIAANLVQDGLGLPNAFPFVLALLAVLAVSVGARFALINLAGFVLLLLAVGWQFSSYGSWQPNSRQDPLDFSNWTRAAAVFAALASGTIGAVTFVTGRMATALRRNETLLAVVRKQSAEKLKALEAKGELEERLRHSHQLEALGQLSAGIAHDFNNLLVIILNNAEFAQRDWVKLAESPNRDLTTLRNAGERAASLTQQLLTFSGGNVGERVVFSLASCIADAVPGVQSLLPASIDVQFTASEAAGCIRGARLEVEQILLNLCLNAKDAMPNGGQLTVSTHSERRQDSLSSDSVDYACLTVQDTGEGMSRPTLSRLFEPFFTTKPRGKGTGLGLSVVHGVVQQYGGIIKVDSALGEGSKFRVFLPETKAVAQSCDSLQTEEANKKAEGTVLAVDDDPDVLEVLRLTLEGAGYTVLTAANGQHALEVYHAGNNRERIRLVITDSTMPILGGRELYEAIHALDSELPFVFCSGYTSGSLPVEFFEHTSCRLVSKPFRQQEMLDCVRSMLRALTPQA